jgi:hypothetical protein
MEPVAAMQARAGNGEVGESRLKLAHSTITAPKNIPKK